VVWSGWAPRCGYMRSPLIQQKGRKASFLQSGQEAYLRENHEEMAMCSAVGILA